MMDWTAFGAQVGALVLCLWLESVAPLFMDRERRVGHGLRNLAVGLVNGLVLTVGLSHLVAGVFQWMATHRFGLLQWLELSRGTEQILGFLLFDLWMYLWHRANHELPWLWIFHRVHHADPAVDATTAVRFHLGEMVLSTLVRLAVIPLLGIALPDFLLYELCLEPVIIFHHSNIAMPESIDRWMRLAVVSPNMHRVHHSDIPAETNANYASILSLWDRLGQTYRQRDLRTVHYGLKDFRDRRWETLPGILSIPLARTS